MENKTSALNHLGIILDGNRRYAKGKDREFILNNYGRKEIDAENCSKIKEIIKRTGALKYCEERFKELIDKSKISIKKADLREEGKKFMLDLADYISAL